jgi:Na+/melibiose symporter-like transporter
MFDLSHGLMFVFFSTTLIISILVVFLSLMNRVKKDERELTEAEKSIKTLKGR